MLTKAVKHLSKRCTKSVTPNNSQSYNEETKAKVTRYPNIIKGLTTIYEVNLLFIH